jgi:MFS transporter, DHA2 family, multidrug resistance protein
VTIAANLTPANGPMNHLLGDMAQRYGAVPGTIQYGHTAALRGLFQLAYREAATLAYADALRLLMFACLVAALLVPLLRKAPVWHSSLSRTLISYAHSAHQTGGTEYGKRN